MNIIPVGKSNSFKSDLSDWKDKFVKQYANSILENIPYLEVDANAVEDLRELVNTPKNDKKKLSIEEAEKRADQRMRSEHFKESLDDKVKNYVKAVTKEEIESSANCVMSHKKRKSKDSSPGRGGPGYTVNTLREHLEETDPEALKSYHMYPETNVVKDEIKHKPKHTKKSKHTKSASCEADCGCDHGDKDKVMILKKKNKPLKNVIKEGDPPLEKDSSFQSIQNIKKQIEERIAKLDTKLSMMDKETRDKLITYWSDELGLPKEWAEALVKEYY